MRKLHPHQEIVGLGGLIVEDFWIWAYSDVLINVVRNAFAEFMVGFALGRLDTPKVGQESVVFHYRDTKVMIRTGAFVQRDEDQTKPSKVNFKVRDDKGKKKLPKDAPPRSADCYVFCLFDYDNFADKTAARNALIDTNHWRFYVLPVAILDERATKKKTVGVTWMDENCPDGPVNYAGLKKRIDTVLGLAD
jgi:hypothetical protein